MSGRAQPAPPRTPQLWGLAAEFSQVPALLLAAEKVRDAGFRNWDVHTPFPVHGLNDAMGLRMTRLPWVTLVCGATGALAGILMQWWMNAHDYPLLVSGKPLWSLPANIPVAFELTILFAALGTFIGMLAGNRLPELFHPLFRSQRFRRVTTDRFFIVIEAKDPRFDSQATREFLVSMGAQNVEALED